MRIILAFSFLLFTLRTASAQEAYDSIIALTLEYSFKNYNIVTYEPVNSDYKIVQVASGGKHIYDDNLITIIIDKENLPVDTINFKGFINYFIRIDQNTYSLSSGKHCILFELNEGRLNILKDLFSNKFDIAAIFSEGLLLYDPKAYRKLGVSWFFRLNNDELIVLEMIKKVEKWDNIKYPASGSTHERFVYSNNKIYLNIPGANYFTTFDINSKIVNKVVLPENINMGYHILFDNSNAAPYLVLYSRDFKSNSKLYAFKDFNLDSIMLIDFTTNKYPYTVYKGIFYSWFLYDKKLSIHKNLTN